MKWLRRFLAALGALWLLLTITPAVRWWAEWMSVGYSGESRPVLIVLGGDSTTNGAVGYSTYLRCIYAYWMWRDRRAEELVLSGGPSSRPLASDMEAFLAGLGVPKENMRLETASTNTRENLAGVAALLRGDPRPQTLLTSDFHMRRSLRIARRNGLHPVPHPVPDILKREQNIWERPALAVALAIETGKLALDVVGGRHLPYN
jgi:uncharacterized SAM-binding protein YcdF (DUF218 family)